MSSPDQSDAARRQQLQASNDALRGQIDGMLADLRRRTAEIQEKQSEAAAKTHEVTSEDGVITARVDATGTLEQLLLSPKAFERTTPEQLARTITSVVREATGSAQQSLQSDFASLAETPELPDLFAGAPYLADFMPSSGPLVAPPDPAAERAARTGKQSPKPQRERPADDDDEPPQSFMAEGRW
ncbi:YbaB/EbfC family nucleoid-associated protein [Saccharopolyspora gregorii]|uniref:YbaB/EbfC family nucleoid-associated protein n=1 Tax=Saccharopolyspora gregorii TaxID=33914 RepID=A0ABP6RWV2_9PSEU|nr:YbaB/EbfC family nucleoid-associated protein [Saccharopolyspora gregorii]